jgi:adenine-specific DNA-methyltransferase
VAYIRDRLRVAFELLTDTGSVFVQIGDANVHLVRLILDEVFGSRNFISMIALRKTGGTTGKYLPTTGDFVLWYGKNTDVTKYRQLHKYRESEEDAPLYEFAQLPDGSVRRAEPDDFHKGISEVRLHRYTVLTSQRIRESRSGFFPITFDGKTYLPTRGEWSTHPHGIGRLTKAGRVAKTGSTLGFVRYLDDFRGVPLTNLWMDLGGAVDPIYVVQTSTKAIERCMLMTTDPGDLVLDPTCGSGTTAYVAEHWGRRWITTDTSRVALALARTRLMAGRFPYYMLSDSPEGAQKESEVTGIIGSGEKTEGDLKKGFVYKRVPHVTLKSIANNEEIDAIHAKWQEKLEPIRAELNKFLKQKLAEWQVPREAAPDWPAKTKEVHEQWWKLRRERQQEIDASIARHAATELFYDQPYEDNRRVRVTGPFTAESLSPHRVIAAEEEQPRSETEPGAESSASFTQSIIENLRKAGVQNNIKNERLKFERLESYAGIYLNAAGEYMGGNKTKRVAVCLGPEYGTVGPDLVKEAAKEAVQGLGFDLLIVCGFAFDPHVGEEVKRYGKLVILPTRMNNDLAMGDELLKKTGAGNLFMVFGEPDIDIDEQKDGTLTVTVKGVDVYDPTTGQIRNSSTDDIACWFIDTDYNGESFFVRHAYFTGADEPYERLKKALRAEIDETAWASIYSTVSRPFPRPQSRDKKLPQIAVKVINHYGDEVMKVFKV